MDKTFTQLTQNQHTKSWPMNRNLELQMLQRYWALTSQYCVRSWRHRAWLPAGWTPLLTSHPAEQKSLSALPVSCASEQTWSRTRGGTAGQSITCAWVFLPLPIFSLHPWHYSHSLTVPHSLLCISHKPTSALYLEAIAMREVTFSMDTLCHSDLSHLFFRCFSQ